MKRAAILGVALVCSGYIVLGAQVQTSDAPTNSLPNPYKTVEHYFKMPEGRTWGSTSAVDIDKDGRSIWVAERCGANSCLDRATGQMSSLPSILKFDATGKLVASFGQGMLDLPARHPRRSRRQHLGDRRPGQRAAAGARRAPGAAAELAARCPLPGATRGHQVFKFSPDGKLLHDARQGRRRRGP